MRIAQVVETLEVGGLERMAVDLATEQKKAGHEVFLYCVMGGGALVEDGSVIMSLPLLQGILGSPNQINAIDVRVTPSTSDQQLQELTKEIQQKVPSVRAVTISEHLSHDEGFKLVKAMSWGTSILALVVGILGVMNTRSS